ncbi:hypothetical protein ABAC460_02765 [Asticcacaulis sp. AC460]|nr:hypothetical protein ABAC460_02765 [Asticcacaulis sp. AC460]
MNLDIIYFIGNLPLRAFTVTKKVLFVAMAKASKRKQTSLQQICSCL